MYIFFLIFSLIVDHCYIKDILDYIERHHFKILSVPMRTVIKILELSMTLPDFVYCLHGLKALAKLTQNWQKDPLPAVSLIFSDNYFS